MSSKLADKSVKDSCENLEYKLYLVALSLSVLGKIDTEVPQGKRCCAYGFASRRICARNLLLYVQPRQLSSFCKVFYSCFVFGFAKSTLHVYASLSLQMSFQK